MNLPIATRDFNGTEINVYGTVLEPLFLAKDIAGILGHTNQKVMIDPLDESEKGVSIVYTLGGPQEMSHVTEDGLYELLFLSRKPVAKAFKKIVKQMLGEIRRNGFTATDTTIEKMLNDPDLIISLAQTVKTERAEKAMLQLKMDQLNSDNTLQQKAIKALTPKAEMFDEVMCTGDLVSIGQVAKLLKLPFGRNKLFELLRERGVFFKNSNEPKQEYVTHGYFELKETVIKRKNHPDKVYLQVFATQKGLMTIKQKYSGMLVQKSRISKIG